MPLQVLVLEDREADAELAVKELEKAGFKVDWQRVETLRDFRLRLTPNLDLILADYSLPGFTVLDALAVLRESKLDIPVLVISGTVGDDRAVECLKLGVTDYILKDRMARLGPAVQRALAEKGRHREIQRAQKALAQSEERMRGILTTVEDVVWSLSLPSGTLTYLNPAVQKLTGRPVEEFLADPQLWPQHVHPEDFAKMKKAQEEAVRWGTYESEYRMVRTDGTVRDVAIRAWTAYDNQGNPSRLEGIFSDVTEKRARERERIQGEIDHREAERLKQLNEFKTRFIAMVAHDLNNVLTAMKINAALLEKDLAGKAPADSKPIRGLRGSIERLEAFLADLLDASRLQSGQLSLQPRSFDAAVNLRVIMDTLQGQAAAQGITMTCDVPASAPLQGDAHRLEQVTVNLVSNAIKFTPAGGHVTVSLAEEGEGLHLKVVDSGRGIAPEDIPKLFQPFVRLGAAPQGKHTGTGLGLFICKGIVDQHGGRIWCESAGPGHGATFHIVLPGVGKP